MSLWNRVLSQYPRFADTLVPGPDARGVTLEELSDPDTIYTAVAAGQKIFSIEQQKHAGQLWFYSLCNALFAPSVTAMVEFDEVPSLDLTAGKLHAVDDYWFGFSTDARLESRQWRRAGEEVGASISPIIDALCVATDLRPAPLWAVAADCLAIAAMQAGEEAFEEELGREVATTLIDGLSTSFTVPIPRFNDAGQLRRASCCMIYHSPKAGMCLSCPQMV